MKLNECFVIVLAGHKGDVVCDFWNEEGDICGQHKNTVVVLISGIIIAVLSLSGSALS